MIKGIPLGLLSNRSRSPKVKRKRGVVNHAHCQGGYISLPWEISLPRGSEKSAEAIVPYLKAESLIDKGRAESLTRSSGSINCKSYKGGIENYGKVA